MVTSHVRRNTPSGLISPAVRNLSHSQQLPENGPHANCGTWETSSASGFASLQGFDGTRHLHALWKPLLRP